MIIKFKTSVELHVVSGFEDDVIIEDSHETFSSDELIYVEILNDDGAHIDIQFGDGSVVLGVKKELFEIIDES